MPTCPTADPKDKSTTWKVVEDLSTMNDHLHERNQRHFAQAQGTPFTIPPLLDLFHHDGLTQTADNVLGGIPPPCNLINATTMLIQEL